MADPLDQPAPVAPSLPSETQQSVAAPADPVSAGASAPSVGGVVTEAPATVVPPPAAGAESTAPEPVKADAPVAEPTLLQKFDEAAKAKTPEAKDAKPGEKKPEGEKPVEAKADEAAKVEAPVVEPIKVDYFKDVKIPETIRIDDDQRGALSSALDEISSGKTVEGVQKLIAMHEKAVTEIATQLAKDQWTAFNDTRKAWRDQVMADPRLGGAGHDTAMAAIARMRDLAVSDAKPGSPDHIRQSAEFDDFLRSTGAGDHPAMLRLLHNFARFFDEPSLPPEGARPPPNIGQPKGESRRGRMYPTMNGDGR